MVPSLSGPVSEGSMPDWKLEDCYPAIILSGDGLCVFYGQVFLFLPVFLFLIYRGWQSLPVCAPYALISCCEVLSVPSGFLLQDLKVVAA